MSYRIGKADIRELSIRSNETRNLTDIAQICTGISIYEDIFSNHISSNISVLDGTSLRHNLSLTGGEEFKLHVSERGVESRELKSDMVIFAISEIVREGFDRERYILNLTTPEQLLDASLSVSKSYHKPISEIVKNVVQEYFTPITGKTLIEIEETKGIHRLIASGITPTSFIRQCIREAESEENPSSIYLFYETIEGYHFITLDKLYKREATQTFLRDTLISSESNPNAVNLLQNSIRYMNFENNIDLIQSQISGQFNSRTFSYDPLTKSYNTHGYNYDKDFIESKYVNRTLNRNVSARLFSNPTTSRFIITNSHRSGVDYITKRDSETQQTFRRRQDFMDRERATLQQYSSLRLTLSIPGNPNVIAGQTVNVILPNSSDTTEEKIQNDPKQSGKYIVSAIAHNIDSTGNFVSVLELLRPGYEEP